MRETTFLHSSELKHRIALIELDKRTGLPLRGVVHDDTSRYMGGVDGHAGLFTTADDLAKFAQMMLDRGQANGVPVSPQHRGQVHRTRLARGSARPAWPRLGYRLALFQQSRRAFSRCSYG